MEPENINTEEYEEEARTALVCEDNDGTRGSITAALEGLGYRVEAGAGADDTFEKLRFNRYDVIVINEKFGGSAEDNKVYKHLQFMPMSNRRHIFVALIGQGLKTADNMTAFSKSANVVVNEQDIPNLKAILKKSVADNDQFYKVYKESLVKLGKR
ncbi:MAG TPA: hypothetical protein VF790_01155 [Dissulfurispiraceae bacterium]